MTVGKRGSVYWKDGETLRIRLMTDGYIEASDDGTKRRRHFGLKHLYHMAKGRTWPEDCLAAGCPRCLQGYKPTARYEIDVDIVTDGAPQRHVVYFAPSLDNAFAALVEKAISLGMDPREMWWDVTKLPKYPYWTVALVETEAGGA